MEPSTEQALREHEEKVTALKAEIAKLKETAKQRTARVTHKAGTPITVASLPGLVVDDNDARVIGEWTRSQFSGSYIGDGYLHDGNAAKSEKTLTFTPKIPTAGRYEVRIAYPAYEGRLTRVPVYVLHADGEDSIYIDQTKAPPIDGRFLSLGTFRFEKDGAGFVLISNEDTKGFVGVDAVQFLPEGYAAIADGTDNSSAEQIKALEKSLKALQETGPKRPVVMSVRDDPKPSDTHIRIRGLVGQKGALVPRGVLTVASTQPPAMPSDSSGRREFATWLASTDNPLTARVYVNRVWHWLFGHGIVRTMDNFGTTGEAPTHPELLDYLAVQFVQNGWSTKRLVREIVLSRTWQPMLMTSASFARCSQKASRTAQPRCFSIRARQILYGPRWEPG